MEEAIEAVMEEEDEFMLFLLVGLLTRNGGCERGNDSTRQNVARSESIS
jgi:hypothetical protein